MLNDDRNTVITSSQRPLQIESQRLLFQLLLLISKAKWLSHPFYASSRLMFLSIV